MAEVDIKSGERLTYSLGLALEGRADPADPSKTGKRTGLALRLSIEHNENLTWYVFGQTTLARATQLALPKTGRSRPRCLMERRHRCPCAAVI